MFLGNSEIFRRAVGSNHFLSASSAQSAGLFFFATQSANIVGWF